MISYLKFRFIRLFLSKEERLTIKGAVDSKLHSLIEQKEVALAKYQVPLLNDIEYYTKLSKFFGKNKK